MKTIEQIRQEAAGYAIRAAGELHAKLEAAPPHEQRDFVGRRMAIENAIELAFLAGWQAGRGGTL